MDQDGIPGYCLKTFFLVLTGLIITGFSFVRDNSSQMEWSSPSPDEGDRQISPDDTETGKYKLLEMDGNFYIAFESAQDGKSSICLKKLWHNSSVQSLNGEENYLFADSGINFTDPDIAYDSGSGFGRYKSAVVCSGDNGLLYLNRFDTDELTSYWSSSGFELRFGQGFFSEPKIVYIVTKNGVLFCGLLYKRDTVTSSEIKITTFKINGQTGVFEILTDGVICNFNTSQKRNLKIDVISRNCIIAWEDDRSGIWQIYSQYLTFDPVNNIFSVKWAPEGIKVFGFQGEQSLAQVKAHSSSNQLSVFVTGEHFNGSNYDVLINKIDKLGEGQFGSGNGIVVGGGFQDVINKDQRAPVFTFDAFGNVVMAVQHTQDAQAGNLDIWAGTLSKLDGNLLPGTLVPVCINPAQQSNPSIVSAKDSTEFAVGWIDKRNTTSGDVYVQKFGTDGAVKFTANGIPVCTSAGIKSTIILSADGSSNFVHGDFLITYTIDKLLRARILGNAGVVYRSTMPDFSSMTINFDMTIPKLEGVKINWEDNSKIENEYEILTSNIPTYNKSYSMLYALAADAQTTDIPLSDLGQNGRSIAIRAVKSDVIAGKSIDSYSPVDDPKTITLQDPIDNLSATSNTSDSAELQFTWEGNKKQNSSEFIIARRRGSSGAFEELQKTVAFGDFYKSEKIDNLLTRYSYRTTDSGLEAATVYEYSVRLSAGENETSDYVVAVSVKTKDPEVPPPNNTPLPPVELKVVYSNDCESARLEWIPNSEGTAPDGYKVMLVVGFDNTLDLGETEKTFIKFSPDLLNDTEDNLAVVTAFNANGYSGKAILKIDLCFSKGEEIFDDTPPPLPPLSEGGSKGKNSKAKACFGAIEPYHSNNTEQQDETAVYTAMVICVAILLLSKQINSI
ncbi:MAG: hypothetical protein HY606_12725 [Planctomycetes bacterium]|nr:hypothetical protein [Planctomycetota bacterium]